MKEESIKTGAIGALIGAALTAGLLVGTGVAVMQADAEELSVKASQQALIDGYASICVAQFEQSANRSEHLKALTDLEVYKRAEYVKRNGWATMPGAGSPYRTVAGECAQRIVETGA